MSACAVCVRASPRILGYLCLSQDEVCPGAGVDAIGEQREQPLKAPWYGCMYLATAYRSL